MLERIQINRSGSRSGGSTAPYLGPVVIGGAVVYGGATTSIQMATLYGLLNSLDNCDDLDKVAETVASLVCEQAFDLGLSLVTIGLSKYAKHAKKALEDCPPDSVLHSGPPVGGYGGKKPKPKTTETDTEGSNKKSKTETEDSKDKDGKKDNEPVASPVTPTPKVVAPNTNLPIGQRIGRFFDRLRGQAPSSTADDALSRIGRTLDEVEDLHSGIPKKTPPPSPSMPDGRMYPPLSDNIVRNADGSIIARTKGHIIDIGKDGSITIRLRSGEVVFQQAGGGN